MPTRISAGVGYLPCFFTFIYMIPIACKITNFFLYLHFSLTDDITAKAPGPCLGSGKLSFTEELFTINQVLERTSIYLQEVCEEISTEIGV